MRALAEMRAIAESLVLRLGAEDVVIFRLAIDLLVPAGRSLRRHHDLALRDRMTADLAILHHEARAGLDRGDPSDPFLECLVPHRVRNAGLKLIGIGEQTVENRQEGIARFVDATTDRDLDVGIDLALRDRILRVHHGRQGRDVGLCLHPFDTTVEQRIHFDIRGVRPFVKLRHVAEIARPVDQDLRPAGHLFIRRFGNAQEMRQAPRGIGRGQIREQVDSFTAGQASDVILGHSGVDVLPATLDVAR